MVAAVVESSIDGARLRDNAAGTGIEARLPDESSTPTCPRALVEVAGLLDPQAALVRAPYLPLGHHRRLVDSAFLLTTDPDDVDRLAALCPRTVEIADGPGDAVLITVIVLDPLPAVNHHAHAVPEETDGDGDPFLPAVHHVHLSTEIGGEEEAPLDRDPVRGRKGRMVAVPDAEDPRLILHEMIRKNPPLILQRPASPVTTAA